MDLTTLTIDELQRGYRTKQFSPVEVLRACEARIAAVEPQVGAFLSRDFAAALAEAETADVSLPLGGIPVGIKDSISVKGQPFTCASKYLADYRAAYDATVVERLRAAGAIPYGRLNMDEFSMGGTTENSAFAPTRNPWDTSRAPGGSSGGAALAAHELPAALGTDTGGGIRQPAALCGCVGLKPTYGRVSRCGALAVASSFDQIGPMARTVRDCAMFLNAIAGLDPRDSTSQNLPAEDFTTSLGREDMRGIRLGLPKEYFAVSGLDARVRASVETAIKQCELLGAEVVEISLPHTEYAVSVYQILATAEASANLARFDGVRFGRRAIDPADWQDLNLRSRTEGFGSEVKRRLVLGTYFLSKGHYDTYYARAQKVRTLICRDFAAAFEQVDAIVSPVTPEIAPPLGSRPDDLLHLADIFTIPANLAGICGISLPCGFIEEGDKRLPVGLQLMAKPFDETCLLAIADTFERASGLAGIVAPL